MASETEKTDAAAASPVTPYEPKRIVYCGVCTLPPEYCEFGGTTAQCEEWLEEHHPEMHQRIYSAEAINSQMSSLSVEARQRAEKDSAKKTAKAAAAAQREAQKREASKVVIKRVERQKRKYVTVVTGMEAFGHDLKKVAKDFGKKFACGSSVTKSAAGTEEITVQGDLQADIEEYVLDVFEDIPADNVECVEDKKKKGAG